MVSPADLRFVFLVSNERFFCAESESQPKKQDSIDTDEEEEVVDAELEKELNEELKGFEVC